MWQYNYTYLCHANNYKYVDKYRDKRGNWQYVYPDDVPQKARTMPISNNRPTNALNKGYSGQDYGKSGNTRFSNVKDQISLDIKSRAAARNIEKKKADVKYRQNVYKSAGEAQEAAERARGEASGKGSQGYSMLGDYKEVVGKGGIGAAVRFGEVVSAAANKHFTPKTAGKAAKDAYDYGKAAKTSNALKAATAKLEADKKAAAERRVAESQNSREAAIQKSAKATQARNEEKRVADMKERSKNNAWHDQTRREFEIQRAANKQLLSNESKKAEDNIKNLKKNIMKGDYEAADKNVKDLRNNEFFANDKNTSENIYKQLRDLTTDEKIKNKMEKDGVSVNYVSRQAGEGRYDLGEQRIEHIYDELKDVASGNKQASLSDQSSYMLIRDMIKNPDKYGVTFDGTSAHDNKRLKQIVSLIEEIMPTVKNL